MSDIESRVKTIIVDKLGVDENEVTNQASFSNDLGADSLDTVELIMEFEKEFNIAIPDEEAEKITRRFLSAIRGGDPQRFVRSIRKIREAKEEISKNEGSKD